MAFDFQTEAGQSDEPTWVTLVEEGMTVSAVDIRWVFISDH